MCEPEFYADAAEIGKASGPWIERSNLPCYPACRFGPIDSAIFLSQFGRVRDLSQVLLFRGQIVSFQENDRFTQERSSKLRNFFCERVCRVSRQNRAFVLQQDGASIHDFIDKDC